MTFLIWGTILLLATAAAGVEGAQFSLPGTEPAVPPGPAEPSLLELLGAPELAAGAASVIKGLPQESAGPASQLASLIDLAESAVDAVRDRHCTQPSLTRARKVAARVSGPQFNLTLTAANCSLSKDVLAGEKSVECFSPGIAYSKSPITFVAKHWTPDVFQDGSCVFSKPVAGGAGGSQERVLFTAGEQLRFGSVAEFAAALKLGGLGVVLGPEAVRSLASTLVAAQQTATQAQQTAREP